ncbi:hypothetical protein GCK72_007546 [Caenorhabditis remanei]|uniref:BTB domain-containing protein n=1 Tax=Caenorhabditis remanei TaxID=31234 RepID=A0A6A5HMD5_CAERE|nr:hypothetical protein GCK72_007546 [Caenorhabditis remanei]KAF1767587.1 hypothetical protein GCK72_007546 [Caenorhabditis remanei]
MVSIFMMVGILVLVEKDELGYIFIDRDPTHFRLILNFMRDGDVRLPDSKQDVDEISREANFYLLEGLMELCSRKLEVLAPKNVSKIRILETDEQVLQATVYAEKPVLIFYFTVHTDGAIREPFHQQERFNIFGYLEKYETEFDIYFRKKYLDDGISSFHIRYKNEVVTRQNFPPNIRDFDIKIQECIEKIERLKSYNSEYIVFK